MTGADAKQAVWNAVQDAADWAKDQPFTDDLWEQVTARIQASLDALADDGVIRRGSVKVDPARNPPDCLAAGKFCLDLEIEGATLGFDCHPTPAMAV
jgi:phage tail sheath protein FI